MDYRKILAARQIEPRELPGANQAAPRAPAQAQNALKDCDPDDLGLTALVERLALAIRQNTPTR